MDILKAPRAEESKFLRQVDEAQQQLNTVRAAIELFLKDEKSSRKKRHISASARAKMAKAQKARWAKIRVAKKNA